MTTAYDLPIDLSTKSHHQHHHHPHLNHHLGHGHHHHHHHLLAAVHNHHHAANHHHHHHHHHLNQLHEAEELAFQQLQLEYLNHQQLCAAFANHPLNRLYAVASQHHHSQQHSPPPPPPHNHQQQFDQLTINTWSPPAHQLSQHLSINSQQQQALCLNQPAAAPTTAAATATAAAAAAAIGDRARTDDEAPAKFYDRQILCDQRHFGNNNNHAKRIDEICDDEQLRKRRGDADSNCIRHDPDVVACLERRHEHETTSIIEENPSPIDLHRSSTSSTHSNASSPSSSSASITSTSSSGHSTSTFLGGNHHIQSGDKKRINRPLTGKHVKHGTGASARTLVALRKVIRQRQQLSAK